MANQPKTNNSPNSIRRIVHLGLGAFFRAHGAVYVQEAVEKSGQRWQITGVSFRSPSVSNMLNKSRGVYHLLEKYDDRQVTKELTIVNRVLFLGEDYQSILYTIVSRETFLVSLTITEKGYCRTPASGKLDLANPDIQHDLQYDRPISAIGLICLALNLRKAAGISAFTVLSCDNLPANGTLTRGLVLEFAALKYPGLEKWITQNGRFPSCMVDRIVPATTESDHVDFRKLTGKDDPALVVHEPFRQWVIEDDFVGGIRPQFELAGAQMVDDVRPFETMKLRMLNGSHSTMAWLGRLLGLTTIHQAILDPDLADFIRYLWKNEIIPTIPVMPNQDLPTYADSIFDRYSNPNIRHSLHQIASDSSQKIPQRILATIADSLAADRKCPGLFLVVAAFLKSTQGLTELGETIPLNDPASGQIAQALQTSGITEALNLSNIFPTELAINSIFQAETSKAWDRLNRLGTRKCVQSILQ